MAGPSVPQDGSVTGSAQGAHDSDIGISCWQGKHGDSGLEAKLEEETLLLSVEVIFLFFFEFFKAFSNLA